METALVDPSPEKMHEWRKKTKYVMYQIMLLSEIWKPVMDIAGEELKKLSDYLGEEHDISVLIQKLKEVKYNSKDDISAINVIAQNRKESLYQEAANLGAKVFYESPGRFSRRIIWYWRVTLGDRTET